MKFIPKTNPPSSLLQFIGQQKVANIHPKYSDLPSEVMKDLRTQLWHEQEGLCCYCMNVITPDSSNIEHFLPQSQFINHEVDYFNLFLACRHSVGQRVEKQHCDVKKGDKLIAKYILHPNAEDFFAYNLVGEIIPISGYKSWAECQSNLSSLNSVQKMVFTTIEVLNLNVLSLTTQRTNYIHEIIPKLAYITTQEQLKREIDNLFTHTSATLKFLPIKLFFLKEKLKRLHI